MGSIGASPDLCVGDCLLDLKTSLRPRFSRAWRDQLLLYALAVQNRKAMHHLSFHLVRQDRTISWPMEEFTFRAAGASMPDLEHLSQELFAVTARSSRLQPQERWQESS